MVNGMAAPGELFEMGTDRDGNAVILVGKHRIVLNEAKQEEFAQLYVATCRQATGRAETVARAMTPGMVDGG
jgi:hypothetical protein